MLIPFFFGLAQKTSQAEQDLEFVRRVAHEVVDSAKVAPGAAIANGGSNSTGFALRVPGGTQTFYPAFWVRDAAMMLGADLVPADEVLGWIKVVAATQPGASGLSFDHGLTVPGFSIPDHITLQGEACWYPGAYTEQGKGAYGFLPPADDAYYFIQMARELTRLSHKPRDFAMEVKTGWGEHPLNEVCDKAFESVATDPKTGLVVCDEALTKTRVDWGFCDTVRKTGECLMPSLLRWRAANQMSELYGDLGRASEAKRYQSVAKTIQRNVVKTFFQKSGGEEGLLVSATGLGHKDDLWGEAFAVWLGILPAPMDREVARHLAVVYRRPGSIVDGQVRHMPPDGDLGGYWEKSSTPPKSYQNGGFWATPTGWMVVALRKSDKKAADQLLHEYREYVQVNRPAGAPFEWISPEIGARTNANYGSSAGLVYIALSTAKK